MMIEATERRHPDGGVEPLSVHPASRLHWRGPGCSRLCSIRFGHDPLAHEAHGRDRLRAEQDAARAGVCRAGALQYRFDDDTVTLDGAELWLSNLERALLRELAARVGRVVAYRDLIVAGWGESMADLTGRKPSSAPGQKALTMIYWRLKRRLGAHGDLVERVERRGLRLRPVSTEGLGS